jgi:hypothetical protein
MVGVMTCKICNSYAITAIKKKEMRQLITSIRCDKHNTLLAGPVCCPICSDCFLEYLEVIRMPEEYAPKVPETQKEQNKWWILRTNEYSVFGEMDAKYSKG